MMGGDDYNKEYGLVKKIGVFFSALGIGGGLIAGIFSERKEKMAEEIYNAALSEYNEEREKYVEKVFSTRTLIVDVVKKKKVILGKPMKKFLKSYRRISPYINFSDSLGIEELKKVNLHAFDENELKQIEKVRKVYLSFNEKPLGKNASDVALLMVQDGTVDNMFGGIKDLLEINKIEDAEQRNIALDEYKIDNISVIAKVSVATIGYGMSQISQAFASARKLDDIKVLAEKIKEQKSSIELKNCQRAEIEEVAELQFRILSLLEPLLKEYVDISYNIIKKHDNFFHGGRIGESEFKSDEKKIMTATMVLVEAAKAVIDSPIISKNGLAYKEDVNPLMRIEKWVVEIKNKLKEIC